MYHKNTVLPANPVEPLGDYKNLPELLIDKANHFASLGKEYYAIDAVTREKRFFSKFEEESRKIASAFYKLGLKQEDMVIFMPFEMNKLHIFLNGVWMANGIPRSSYPEDDAATLRSRIEDGNAKFILCDETGISTCKEAVKGVQWPVEVILMDKHEKYKSIQQFLEEDDGAACPKTIVGLEDNAIILCTSGSTGPSKGAVHTHSSYMFQIHMLSLFPLLQSKPNLLYSKATHITGTALTLCALISGKTAITSGKLSSEITLKVVDELKPGLIYAFPTFILPLVGPDAKKYDVSSVEIVWTGGTVITPVMKQELCQSPNVRAFVNGYGFTEGMAATTTAILGATEEPLTIPDLPDFSTGRTYPDTYMQIRDTTTLEVLGPNQKGEIWVKSPGNFREYYKNPEATKNAFVDGFYRTGDIGYYDVDQNFYITDRLKDIFKYYNNHISPSELENIIGLHPNVKEVSVIGISDPDGGGDIPRAIITVTGNPPQGIADKVKEFANDKLASYKHLRGGVYVVPELPKGKTGKVTRDLVAKLQLAD